MLKETALILAGHGSTKNAESSRFTRETAHRLRERGIFAEVRAGFWKEEPSFADALRGLQSKRAVVVPWFLAKGYFTTQILPREFGETAGVECRVTEPIGSRPEILGQLQKRAARLLALKKWERLEVSLLLASHGTPLHAGSRGAAVDLAGELAKDGYRMARAVFLEEEPKIADWKEVVASGGPVIVLPHFLAGGLHGSESRDRRPVREDPSPRCRGRGGSRWRPARCGSSRRRRPRSPAGGRPSRTPPRST